MKLIRSYIHHLLSEDLDRLDKKNINEGVWDALKDIFKGMRQIFSAAVDSIDSGKFKTRGANPSSFNTKENPVDQLMAASLISQIAGLAVIDPIQSLLNAKTILEDNTFIELPQTESEIENFNNSFEQLNESIATAYGSMVGWLTHKNDPYLKKLIAIGQSANPGENSSSMIENMGDVVEKLADLNIPGSVQKILNSKALLAMRKQKRPDSDELYEDSIDEWTNYAKEYLDNLNKIDQLKEIMEEIYEDVKELESVITEMGQEDTVDQPDAESIDLLSHYDIINSAPEDKIRMLIREIINS